MARANRIDAMRRRAGWIAVLFAAALAAGPALAADDTSLDDSAKKVGNNFGEMLEGMGQELKKAGGSLTGSDKKAGKKEKQKSENESGKDKDSTR
jgi:ABC-type sugar transport system substrate-binding protein